MITTTWERSLMPSGKDLLLIGGVIVAGVWIYTRYFKGSTSGCCDHLTGLPKILCNLGGDLTGDFLGGSCVPPEPKEPSAPWTPSPGDKFLCEYLRGSYCFNKANFPTGFNQSQYDLCMAANNECENL